LAKKRSNKRKHPAKAKIPISTIQNPMSFLSSIPLWGWLDIGFNVIVLLALAGETEVVAKWFFPEKITDLIPPEPKRKKLKKLSEGFLIIGIIGEIGCLFFSIYGTASAENKAGQANERAITNELQVLDLKTNLAQLNKATLELAHQYDLSTNALAEAKARLASVRPLKDMFVSVLNDIDPKIIPALKGGQTVFNLSAIPEYKFSQLHALLNEPGASAYCSGISSSVPQMIIGVGFVEYFTIALKPELAQ
jgi:hypothetical protein